SRCASGVSTRTRATGSRSAGGSTCFVVRLGLDARTFARRPGRVSGGGGSRSATAAVLPATGDGGSAGDGSGRRREGRGMTTVGRGGHLRRDPLAEVAGPDGVRRAPRAGDRLATGVPADLGVRARRRPGTRLRGEPASDRRVTDHT